MSHYNESSPPPSNPYTTTGEVQNSFELLPVVSQSMIFNNSAVSPNNEKVQNITISQKNGGLPPTKKKQKPALPKGLYK